MSESKTETFTDEELATFAKQMSDSCDADLEERILITGLKDPASDN